MKQIIGILALTLVVFLLASCVPVEHDEMLPFCKTQYETLLGEYPDYPPAFVGACVSWLQSGKPTAFVSLCGYESFRQQIMDGNDVELNNRQDCIQFIKNFEE